jgi:hypothetical protein
MRTFRSSPYGKKRVALSSTTASAKEAGGTGYPKDKKGCNYLYFRRFIMLFLTYQRWVILQGWASFRQHLAQRKLLCELV